MAVGTFNAVIWEWQRDDGGYAPYHPEVSHAIEEARNSGKNILNLGTISKELSPYHLDVRNFTQTRSSTGMVRSIRRSPIQISGAPCNAVWEWQDGSLRYNFYGINAMMEIEEAYVSKQPSVDLSKQPSQLPYTIDFSGMYQIRHHYNTQRKIRRTALSKPLQIYLTSEFSLGSTPPAVASLGTVYNTTFPLHSIPASGGTAYNITPSVYTVSMPSVYSHHNRMTTSVSTFDTKSQFSSTPASIAPVVSATGMASSHGKGSSKTTTSRVKVSKSKATGKTAKLPAKRCKTKAKVEKPAAKSRYD